MVDICAVVTCYSPDDGFPSRIERVKSQVNHVIIVNDSNQKIFEKQLHKWFHFNDRVTICNNRLNVGLAASLNVGVNLAIHLKYAWVLLLDDDTIISARLVEVLKKGMLQVGVNKNIASISTKYERGYEHIECVVGNELSIKTVASVITSGSLISCDVFLKLGQFNENYFIDCVDHEYCARANLAKFRVLEIDWIGLTQPLGKVTVLKIFRWSCKVSQHSSLRTYYMFRNVTHFISVYLFSNKLLVMSLIYYLVRYIIKVTIISETKAKYIKAIYFGFLDGVAKKLGRCKRVLIFF